MNRRTDLIVIGLGITALILIGCATTAPTVNQAQTIPAVSTATTASSSASETPQPPTSTPSATVTKTPSAAPSSAAASPSKKASGTTAPGKPVARGAVTQPPLGTQVNCAVTACVALTFDDGPGTRTAELVQTLAKANVPATFFMLSSVAANNPSGAAAVAANPSMEIANHSISHANLANASAATVNKEMVTSQKRLEKQTGRKITLFRPPYGAMNSTVKKTAASSGQAIITWDVDTLDWKHRTPAKTVSIALSEVSPGSIILMHDIHSSTVKAVPDLIAALNKRGYTMVTVSTLLGSVTPGKVYSHR